MGVKRHMGKDQKAYGCECAAIARAITVAGAWRPQVERIVVYTDSQAAVKRMSHDNPGPGQKWARQAVESRRKLGRETIVEVRWCPSHKGIPGNEKADEWAKHATERPGSRDIEWPRKTTYGGSRKGPEPRSLASLKMEATEKKWADSLEWARGKVKGKKYSVPKTQSWDMTVADSGKRVAARYYQLKTGHALTGQHLAWTKNRPTAECWWCGYKTQTREHLFKNCTQWREQQKILWTEVRKKIGRGKDRFKIRDLFANQECSKAVLYFLTTTTDVGRRVPPLGKRNKNF
ncbi:hypothetical protein BZA05DRAFT_394570 [Tricharina praecox]|uniref:uncharacterized protein n=1 Tax=Tricharina praecox TaxID=43433 RepID=UPI00221F2FF8|nr:uncharacterized protein BZA05DRAFT_394570 [Tricharina praecox]KAI5853747.1 hypothetical protein BZA05DRAFT_394570 [Tricharina praecox]